MDSSHLWIEDRWYPEASFPLDQIKKDFKEGKYRIYGRTLYFYEQHIAIKLKKEEDQDFAGEFVTMTATHALLHQTMAYPYIQEPLGFMQGSFLDSLYDKVGLPHESYAFVYRASPESWIYAGQTDCDEEEAFRIAQASSQVGFLAREENIYLDQLVGYDHSSDESRLWYASRIFLRQNRTIGAIDDFKRGPKIPMFRIWE